MATNTTNFNLIKPEYTDTADIADINGNMDKVDASLNGLADAIAIVANNNTHAAITAGQYVYVHGHGSLAEGLYTAKSNIAANATLSTSNLQADGSGGLNSVYSTLNSNVTSLATDVTNLKGIIRCEYITANSTKNITVAQPFFAMWSESNTTYKFVFVAGDTVTTVAGNGSGITLAMTTSTNLKVTSTIGWGNRLWILDYAT